MTGDALLLCAAGRDEFAFRAEDVRHVARIDQLRADDTADGRAGTLKVAGQHVPVFGLLKALGLRDADERPHAEQHIAVTGEGTDLVGWLVDRIAREPIAGDMRISPLPSFIGGNAQHWFEAIVTGADREPTLLIKPAQLNPLAKQPAPADDPETFAPPGKAAVKNSEAVALIFSTPALPPSPAERYALSGKQVAAIVQPTDPMMIPGCAAHIAGLTFWRDFVVPVVDFRKERTADAANERRLIARCGPMAGRALVAFAIDVEVLMHRPAPDNRLVWDVPGPPFASGLFEVDGERVALVDLDILVATAA